MLSPNRVDLQIVVVPPGLAAKDPAEKKDRTGTRFESPQKWQAESIPHVDQILNCLHIRGSISKGMS